MSTIKTHRARKVVLIMLGVTSIATVGLIVANAEFNGNNSSNINETNNLTDNILNPLINDVMLREIKKVNYKTNISSVLTKNKDVQALVASMEIPELYEYKKYTVIATGYTAGIESTGKDINHPEYGITYSGVQVRRDLYSTIAADLNVFPLGTILYIPNYGYGVVTDIGSAIKGNKIDLYFETVDDVYSQWGKRKVDVYVIKYGNGYVTDSLLEQYNQVAMANLAS